MQNCSHYSSKCEASVFNTWNPAIDLSTIQFLMFFLSEDVFGKVNTVVIINFESTVKWHVFSNQQSSLFYFGCNLQVFKYIFTLLKLVSLIFDTEGCAFILLCVTHSML
jgi:hypothetical protein